VIKKYFLCAYFPLIPPKSVYLIRKKCASAKFSGVFQIEKMALQNFPAFFKLKKWLCKIFQRFSNRKNGFAKFSSVFQTEKMLLQNFPAFFKLKKCFCKIFQHLFYNIDRDEIEITPGKSCKAFVLITIVYNHEHKYKYRTGWGEERSV
jgi:hypothetical protein